MNNPLSFIGVGNFNLARVQDLYVQFLNNFPVSFQPVVSVAVGLFIIYVIYRIIKRDFIFIVLLVILVPTSLPVLKSVWSGLVSVIKFLFNLN